MATTKQTADSRNSLVWWGIIVLKMSGHVPSIAWRAWIQPLGCNATLSNTECRNEEPHGRVTCHRYSRRNGPADYQWQ